MINITEFKNNRANSFLILSFVGLFFIALLLFSYFERLHEKDVVSELQSTLSQQASNQQSVLTETFRSGAADVRFLANTPPISGIIRATNNNGFDENENTSKALWQERLSRIFYAFMSSQPEIAQIRYIGKDNNGMELVRVERQHGTGAMRILSANQLQAKGSRNYFQKTAQLQSGEIYLSDITLNREHGRLDYPLWPSYRVATPIYNDSAEFFGIVIINYNAQFLLDTLQTGLPQGMDLYITNSVGQYLLHPDPTKSLEFERNPEATTWHQDFKIISKASDILKVNATATDKRFLTSLKQVELTGDEEQRYINFVVALPETNINATIAQRRQASTVILLSLVLVGGLIITIYRKILIKQVDLSFAQSQYSALIEGSRDAILTLSVDGKIENWNQATYEVLKLPPFGIEERRLEDVIDSQDKKALTENINACLAGKTTATLEVKSYTSAGDLLALSVSLSPIHKDKHTIVGGSIIIRDITEQVINKQQLEQLNESLEEKVRTRTKELEQARNEAVEASNMKSSFVANVSHEIRTPLNGILGMHNLLARENLNQKQASYLEMASQSAKSLLMLINDILDLSKIEAGRLEIEQLPTNLIDNFSQAANSMAARAMDKNVEIVLDIAEIKHPVVMSDGLRLRQILNNLISNAIKFTDTGEIIISASTREDVANHRIILEASVRDTGVGIEKTKLNHLFKAFSQEDASTTRQYGGTGLGLSIVSNLCSLMDGECRVESQKNVGSTFSFTLSMKATEEEQLTLDKMLNLHNYTIQIAESSETVRKALNKLLTGWRATTLLTEDKPDQHVDIVISQLGKHGVDDETVRQQIADLSEQDYFEQFIFTVTFKQRHCLEDNTPAFTYQVIHRPILPLQLATALSELTDEPLRQINKASTTGKNKQLGADSLTGFDGSTILIVDDNEINQRVAAGILEHYGMQIELASNGAKAIELLNTLPDIKLILMDCQMPVMDGFKATEAIRRGEAGIHYRKVPIIAMTAGAMTGDREECLNAGMNDYLAKPISAQDLESKTSLWLAARPQSKLHAQPGPRPEPVTIDIPAPPPEMGTSESFWDREESLVRLLSNEDLFLKMLEMFEQQTPSLIIEIGEHIAAFDFTKIRQSAHKLKGSAAAIGAKLVLNEARKLESAAFDEQEKASLEAYEAMKNEVDRMLSAINDYKIALTERQNTNG